MNNSIINNFAQKINEKEKKSNKVTALSSSVTDSQYPSAKAVYDAINNDYGSFAELQNLINNTALDGTLILDKDYKNTGNEGYITITQNITIIGNGHTIDADSKNKIIEIRGNNVESSFHDIVFLNGVKKNDLGCAIFSSSTGKINVFNCSFINCGGGLYGGAIYSIDVAIKDSMFINNTAQSGGALYSIDGEVQDCLFINNRAKSDGGAVYFVSPTRHVKDSLFLNNTVATGNGGGVYSKDVNNYEVYNCIFDQNSTLYNTVNVSYIQSLSDYVQKSQTRGLLKNDGTVDTTAYSTFDGNYNNLTNKPSIPSASSTVPSADTTNGSVGDGTTWARSNHTHPKSSLYAEASHTHSQYLTSHQDITGKEDILNKVTSIDGFSTDDEYPSAKCVYDGIWTDFYGTIQGEYVQGNDLGTVALSNDYDDLDNKPTIPSNTSDLTNDSGFITNSSVPSASSTTPSADTTSGSVGTGMAWARSDHTHPKSSLYEDNANKVTSLSSSSTDTQYPSAKAVYDAIENTFNLDTLDCINENFTILSLPQIIITYNESSLDGASAYIFSRYEEGAYVDWGDGTPIETYEPNDILEHEYSDNIQEHTIVIYGNTYNGSLYYASFKGLSGITSINIPSAIHRMESNIFLDCTGLTSVNLPQELISVGNSTFKNCINLNTIILNWTEELPPIYYGILMNGSPSSISPTFSIPYGTTSLYESKGYPIEKLVERSE